MMNDTVVTALLLNWKRPENLKQIINQIKEQSIPINIFLWNNNISDNTAYDVDLQINSNKNLLCSPRWLMAGYTKTKYVFSLDDDLIFKDNNVIKDCILYLENNDSAIGAFGVILNNDRNYWRSKHIKCDPNKDQLVDIIKGRFIFCRREDTYKSNIVSLEKRDNYRIEDDIVVSSYLNKKIIPSFLYNRFVELPDHHAYCKHREHRKSRMEAVKKYFVK